MANRLQDLYNEYSKKEFEIENNKKIIKECYDSLNAIKNALSEDTKAIVNSYYPGLLDLLVVKEEPTIDDVMELKNSLEFVRETLYKSVEEELK